MALIDLANPTRFLRLVDRVLPWLAAATLIVFAVGLFQAMHAPAGLVLRRLGDGDLLVGGQRRGLAE